MGQAKQRGTFEERKNAAINRDFIEGERQLQERREIEMKKQQAARIRPRGKSQMNKIILAALVSSAPLPVTKD